VARPSPRSLILDLLSTLRGGSMPVAALVAAGALFELAENSMRVAVARLLAGGQLERDERGRYRLGAGAEPVDRRVRAWRRIEERTRRWDGGWIGVLAAPGSARRRRGESPGARARRLLGFAPLEGGLALRPDNLRGGVAETREDLEALGLEEGALVFGIDEFDPVTDARARGLWDAAGLAEGYARSLRDLESSAAQLPRLGEAEAMVESFLLGGRVIRQLVLDPLLPDPVAPCGERRALVEALRRYDRLGRRAWAPFLERHGVAHAETPAALRAGEPGRPRLH
jgi:phenylacetic acid degradation operon negative regulatory protein